MSSIVSDTTVAVPPSSTHEAKTDEKDLSREQTPSPTSSPLPNAAEVHELARTLTRTSSLHRTKSHTGAGLVEFNVFSELNDNKKLDPLSPEFDVRAWVASITQITSRDPERYPSRSAGVSF